MHRPERWGYVQFSTAKPGQAAYRIDPAAAIRDRLMQLYYAAAILLRAEQEVGDVARRPQATGRAELAPAYDESSPHIRRL